jgi:hypothetical protein
VVVGLLFLLLEVIMAKRQCWECDAINSFEYDCVTGGYVCEECGTLFSAESVEMGDMDIE